MFNFINNIVERRFLSGALVGSLMLLGVSMLSGCGDKSDGDTADSAAETTTTTTETTPTTTTTGTTTGGTTTGTGTGSGTTGS